MHFQYIILSLQDCVQSSSQNLWPTSETKLNSNILCVILLLAFCIPTAIFNRYLLSNTAQHFCIFHTFM